MISTKKIICLIAILIVIFTLVSCKEIIVTTEGVIFEKIEGKDEYAIVGYTGTLQDVIIAERHESFPVTQLKSDAFKDLDIEIKSLILPDTISLIEKRALTEVELLVFNIPRDLYYFADAFYPPRNIEFILPTNHKYHKEILINEHKSIVTKDEKELIYVFDTVLSGIVLTLPDSIMKIGPNALMSTHFSQIVVPDTVEEVGDNAFFDTPETLLNIPSNIIKIGIASYAKSSFSGALVLPDGLIEIGSGAFMDNSISTISFPASISTFGLSIFKNTANAFDQHNIISKIIFHSFSLNQISIDEFVFYFVYLNFEYFYSENTIEIVLPIDDTEADVLRDAITRSHEQAVVLWTNSQRVIPDLTFTFTNP